MSMQEKTIVKCEHCGGEYEFTWYRSINVSLDPELKEKVINGDIFRTKCPHCGEDSYMLFPFLYHDMEHQFMIYVSTKEDVEANVKIMKEQPYGPEDVLPMEIHGVSFEEYEKIETLILSYEYGYNPELVDAILYCYSKNIDETMEGTNGFDGVKKCYLHEIDGKLKMIFEFNEEGNGVNLDFSNDEYKEIEKELKMEEEK